MCETRFFICRHCGNLIGMINDSGVPIICCGEPMSVLIPDSEDASVEKHVPIVKVSENIVTVEVGSIPHPMTDEHYIPWVYLKTESGGQRKCLKPGDPPVVKFAIDGDKPLTVFAYCNLHGLWKAEV